MIDGFNAYVDTHEDVISLIKTILRKLNELEQENEELREEIASLKK